jgi:hypothetical protein
MGLMKSRLNISLSLNLALLALVIYLLTGRQKKHDPIVDAAAAGEVTTTAVPVVSAPTIVPVAKGEPFRWSQLEASDYKIYISNLRNVGCPEQTIRDIITADVDASVYADRRKPLEKKRAANGSASSLVRESAQMELEKLNDEETALLAELLGSPVNSSNQLAADVSTPSPSRTLRDRAAEAPSVMPVVLRDVDLSGLNLSAGQSNVIAGLRQKFVDEVGGANQDPGDPAYRERWNQAQANADDRLKAMLGLRAYQTMEFHARTGSNH